MIDDNVIVLTDREEIESNLGDRISNEEWLNIKERLARSKYMWQVIDETIGEVIGEL